MQRAPLAALMLVETIVGLVLFTAAPCPTLDARACTIDEEPPQVYVDPAVPDPLHEWLWEHELGHVHALRTPGAVPTSEHDANAFAACHTPAAPVFRRYRWVHGYPAGGRLLRRWCRIRGLRS